MSSSYALFLSSYKSKHDDDCESCASCAGTGMGRYEDWNCSHCHGTGDAGEAERRREAYEEFMSRYEDYLED